MPTTPCSICLPLHAPISSAIVDQAAPPAPPSALARMCALQVMALWEEAQHTSSIEVQDLHNRLLHTKEKVRVGAPPAYMWPAALTPVPQHAHTSRVVRS